MQNAFFNYIWQNIVLKGIDGVLVHMPWWGWAILAGFVVALAIKVYTVLGWRGVAAIVAVVVSFAIYRQGWANAVQAHQDKQFPDQPDKNHDLLEPRRTFPSPTLPVGWQLDGEDKPKPKKAPVTKRPASAAPKRPARAKP